MQFVFKCTPLCKSFCKWVITVIVVELSAVGFPPTNWISPFLWLLLAANTLFVECVFAKCWFPGGWLGKWFNARSSRKPWYVRETVIQLWSVITMSINIVCAECLFDWCLGMASFCFEFEHFGKFPFSGSAFNTLRWTSHGTGSTWKATVMLHLSTSSSEVLHDQSGPILIQEMLCLQVDAAKSIQFWNL